MGLEQETMKNNCEIWLHAFLAKNPLTDYKDVMRAAKNEGFSRKEMKDARKSLGVKTYHRFVAGTDVKQWLWYLPSNNGRRF